MYYAELHGGVYTLQSPTLEGLAAQLADTGATVTNIFCYECMRRKCAAPNIPADELAEDIYSGDFTDADLD